jgi:hypothetical protein
VKIEENSNINIFLLYLITIFRKRVNLCALIGKVKQICHIFGNKARSEDLLIREMFDKNLRSTTEK